MKKKQKSLSYEERIHLQFVPLKDVASICLGRGIPLSIGTLNRWIQEGRVEYTKIGGRTFFSQEQINKIVQGEIKNESK